VPIQITCTTCGKKLQIGDQYGGKRVGCPGCKTVLTAPGTAAAPLSPPSAAPAAPKGSTLAAKPVPPKAATPAPRPAPPLPLDPDDEPETERTPSSFAGKSKKTDIELDDDEDAKPKAKAPDKRKEMETAKKEAPKSKKRGNYDEDEDDFGKPTRKARSRLDDAEEDVKPTAKAWKSFGSGNSMAKLGVWVEFLASVYGLAILGYIFVGIIEEAQGTPRVIANLGGPFILAPFFAGMFLGVVFTLMGRTRMLSIPEGTGAKKVFVGTWLFTMIRFLAVTAALIFVVLSGLEWSDARSGGGFSRGGDYLGFAFLATLIALPFWILADFSIVPAIAIVGGAMPSLHLRRRVGSIAFGLQILLIAQIAVGIVGGYVINDMEKKREVRQMMMLQAEFESGRFQQPGMGRPTFTVNRMLSGNAENEEITIIVVLSVLLITQLVYTSLFASLYGGGRRAVDELREAEEAAEDEDL
jgi:hypothetical protein